MTSPQFRSPSLLVYALFISPALVVLHACNDQPGGAKRDSKSPPALSKSADRTAPSPPPGPTAPPVFAAGFEEALLSLTAANAPQRCDHLRSDSQQWSNQVAIFYRAWAALDPAAALRSTSTEGPLALTATLGVIEGWTTTDPHRARDWVEQEPSGALFTRYAGTLIRSWPADDFDALALWAQSHPSLLPQVTAKWATTSPAEAARWLGTLSPGSHHHRATEGLFRVWAREDPGAAGDYLVATRDFPNRDAALAAYATTVVNDDPAAAAQWGREISDPGLRERVLQALPSIRPLGETTPGALSGTPR